MDYNKVSTAGWYIPNDILSDWFQMNKTHSSTAVTTVVLRMFFLVGCSLLGKT